MRWQRVMRVSGRDGSQPRVEEGRTMAQLSEPLVSADLDLLNRLVELANEKFEGYLTISRSTTNWRVSFGAPRDHNEIKHMIAAPTFGEAATLMLLEEEETLPD